MIINNNTGEINKSDTTTNIDKYIQSYHKNMTELDKTDRIEQVIKALGTMVLVPTEITDPNNIGQKVYGQPVQRPILEGANRDKVLNKLVELIVE